MSPILLGNKRIEAGSGKPAEKHTVLTVTQAIEKAARQMGISPTQEDPIGSFAGRPQVTLLATFGDGTLAIEQWIHEMAALACKQHRLTRKLTDPALEDSPHRPAAEARRDEQARQIAEYAIDISWTEARLDRVWQAMTPISRKQYASWWNVDVDTDRLIGQAWRWHTGLAEWPEQYTMKDAWFRSLDPYVRRELYDSGARGLKLKRNPERPPF